MKKKINRMMGMVCYGMGILFALYVGGWLMLIKPINALIMAFKMGNLTMAFLLKSIIKIAFSTTVGGFVWCMGYLGYNFFKGTEENLDQKQQHNANLKEKQI